MIVRVPAMVPSDVKMKMMVSFASSLSIWPHLWMVEYLFDDADSTQEFDFSSFTVSGHKAPSNF